MNTRRNISGTQVQKIRNARNITQTELSARCTILGFDISRAAISHIETGYRSVSDLEMVLLSKALRCDLSDLVPETLPSWKKDTRSKPKT